MSKRCGIRFANYSIQSGSDARDIVSKNSQVEWANSVMTIASKPISNDINDVSGVISFRFRDKRKYRIPDVVKNDDEAGKNAFGVEIL
jgi:hypothetical protein